jgi:hypothetical protein
VLFQIRRGYPQLLANLKIRAGFVQVFPVNHATLVHD